MIKWNAVGGKRVKLEYNTVRNEEIKIKKYEKFLDFANYQN